MYKNYAVFLILTGSALLAGCGSEPAVSFDGKVKPIIASYCAECHLDGGKGYEASGFRVDSYESIMKGTKFGPVIVPGSPESSTLYRMVAGLVDKSIRMPHSKEPMNPDEVATIANWIAQGAKNN